MKCRYCSEELDRQEEEADSCPYCGKEIDIERRDVVSNKKLFRAIDNANEKQVAKLIRAGIDINAKNEEGLTPLMYALDRHSSPTTSHFDEFKLLFEAGADRSITNDKGENAFILAVKSGKKDVVEVFLDNGEDVNFQTADGNTALIYAKGLYRGLEVVKMLLEAGANVHIKNNEGRNVLEMGGGLRADDKKMDELVLKAGAKVKDTRHWINRHHTDIRAIITIITIVVLIIYVITNREELKDRIFEKSDSAIESVEVEEAKEE